MKKTKDPGKKIEAFIRDWVNTSAGNSLGNAANDRAWDDPLVGFSQGDDAYWQSFKEHVGSFHWTPAEAFGLAFPGNPAEAAELTVISWVLPQTKTTKLETRKENVYPPESWARARFYGETFNEMLRKMVVAELHKEGIRATAPVLIPEWSRMVSDKFVFASKWSERHAAFVSGLGTFGLSDGLITPRGKAIRVGSVVAEMQAAPTPRPYKGHRDYCLWFSKGTCKKCVKRCPVAALSGAGHDKVICERHIDRTCRPYILEHYKFPGYACGLCQTGVPCESRIPVVEDSRRSK